MTGTSASMNQTSGTDITNEGTEDILRACAELGGPEARLIYASYKISALLDCSKFEDLSALKIVIESMLHSIDVCKECIVVTVVRDKDDNELIKVLLLGMAQSSGLVATIVTREGWEEVPVKVEVAYEKIIKSRK